jgi:hypothetical protein
MLNWETIQSVASSGVQRGTPRQPRLAHQLSPLIFRKHDLHGRRTQIRRSRSYCSLEAFADHAAEFWLTIGGKFSYRYSTLGFQDAANLDGDDVWPVSYAPNKWRPMVEKKVAELVTAVIS